ncbi:hypothetical protein BGZ76_011424 [Entomortierella beljakovae]|nr:hypothetical protein BGZ76_011424 [Entomortierella beljakovae]
MAIPNPSQESQELSQDSTESLSLGIDSSPIIPSMIPTQEVLENIGFYRGDGKVRLEGYNNENEGKATECYNNSISAQLNNRDITIPAHSTELLSTVQPTSLPSTPKKTTLGSNSTDLTPTGSPPILRTYSRKHPITSPQHKPKMAIEEFDPIMDFDDSEEEGDLIKEQGLDVNPSTSRTSASSQTRKLVSPYGSLSRRFILPITTQPASDRSNNSTPQSARLSGERHPPESPSKRLRPLSDIHKPIISAHLHTQGSPSRKNGTVSPRNSPRNTRILQTNSKSVVSPRPLKPLSKAMPSMIGKSTTQVPKALRPPPALGPQLMKIANAIRNGIDLEEDEYEAEETLIRKRSVKGNDQSLPGHSPQSSSYNKPALGIADLIVSHESAELSHRLESGQAEIELLAPQKFKPAMKLKEVASKSPFIVSNTITPRPPKARNTVHFKKEEPLTPVLGIPEMLQEEALSDNDTPARSNQAERSHKILELQEQEEFPLASSEIPLPSLVLEYIPKLTPLDHIKWPPAKAGRFHIFGLVIFVGPEEQVVTKMGQNTSKREITLCDHSATSFKLNLWGECCKWADSHFGTGDAVLITDKGISAENHRQYQWVVKGSKVGWIFTGLISRA